jgi:prophage DNA circulation protein
MSYFDQDKLVETALERFDHIHSLHVQGAAALTNRLNFLYRVTFLGLALVLGALFFLVIVISAQMSNMNRVISVLNGHVGEINQDMNRMLATVSRLDTNMEGMAGIVRRMDDINGSVGTIAVDMGEVHRHMAALDRDVERLSAHVGDMRESFHVMDGNMGLLADDVQHMSQPMRLFNQFNPFW